jgi:hypothetical protein
MRTFHLVAIFFMAACFAGSQIVETPVPGDPITIDSGQGLALRRESILRDSVRRASGRRSAMAGASAGETVEGRLQCRPQNAGMHSSAAATQHQSLFRRGADQ